MNTVQLLEYLRCESNREYDYRLRKFYIICLYRMFMDTIHSE